MIFDIYIIILHNYELYIIILKKFDFQLKKIF
jgi:hypothetical protein